MADTPEEEDDIDSVDDRIVEEHRRIVSEHEAELDRLKEEEKTHTDGAAVLQEHKRIVDEGTRVKLYRLHNQQQERVEQARAAKAKREELESVLKGTWTPQTPEATPSAPTRREPTGQAASPSSSTADAAPTAVTPPTRPPAPAARPAPIPEPARTVQPGPTVRLVPEPEDEPEEESDPDATLTTEPWVPTSESTPPAAPPREPRPFRPTTGPAPTPPPTGGSQDQPTTGVGRPRLRPVPHRELVIDEFARPTEPTGTEGLRPAGPRSTRHDRRSPSPTLTERAWKLARWSPRTLAYRAGLYFVAFWAGVIIDVNWDIFQAHGLLRFFLSVVLIGLLMWVAHRYGGDFAGWMDKRHERKLQRQRDRNSRSRQNP